MKKAFLAFLFIIIIGVLPAFAEEFKTFAIDENLSIQVPELSPDFRNFSGNVIGSQKFENGNYIAGVELANKEGSVYVLILLVSLKDKLYIVAEQVTYFQDVNNPVTENLEDIQFMIKGKPSGKLTYTKEPTDFKVLQRWLDAKEI